MKQSLLCFVFIAFSFLASGQTYSGLVCCVESEKVKGPVKTVCYDYSIPSERVRGEYDLLTDSFDVSGRLILKRHERGYHRGEGVFALYKYSDDNRVTERKVYEIESGELNNKYVYHYRSPLLLEVREFDHYWHKEDSFGRIQIYDLDEKMRVSRYTWFYNRDSAKKRTTTYTYNKAGQIEEAKRNYEINTDGTDIGLVSQYKYDSLGNMTAEHCPPSPNTPAYDQKWKYLKLDQYKNWLVKISYFRLENQPFHISDTVVRKIQYYH